MATSKKKAGKSKTKSKKAVAPKVAKTEVNQNIVEIPNVELVEQPTTDTKVSKTENLVMLLTRENGATLEELAEATGWLPNSVRGALSAYTKKHPEYLLISEKIQGIRTYRLSKVFNN